MSLLYVWCVYQSTHYTQQPMGWDTLKKERKKVSSLIIVNDKNQSSGSNFLSRLLLVVTKIPSYKLL